MVKSGAGPLSFSLLTWRLVHFQIKYQLRGVGHHHVPPVSLFTGFFRCPNCIIHRSCIGLKNVNEKNNKTDVFKKNKKSLILISLSIYLLESLLSEFLLQTGINRRAVNGKHQASTAPSDIIIMLITLGSS